MAGADSFNLMNLSGGGASTLVPKPSVVADLKTHTTKTALTTVIATEMYIKGE